MWRSNAAPGASSRQSSSRPMISYRYGSGLRGNGAKRAQEILTGSPQSDEPARQENQDVRSETICWRTLRGPDPGTPSPDPSPEGGGESSAGFAVRLCGGGGDVGCGLRHARGHGGENSLYTYRSPKA